MEPRALRGAEIVRKGGLKKRGRYIWVVPSQTHRGAYVVDVRTQPLSCTCPDFGDRLESCKHVFAVQFHRGQATLPAGYVVEHDVGYTQNWPAYSRAQEHEKEHFEELLRELCGGIITPRREGKGRRPKPLGLMAFSCVMKVYGTMSGRRSSSDIKRCVAEKLVVRAPHYNTMSKYLRNEEMTPILQEMLLETSLPLADLETVFVADATGFSASTHRRWVEQKWGPKSLTSQSKRGWIKAHAIAGAESKIVTHLIVTGHDGSDSVQLPELLRVTDGNFNMFKVCADKAYLSRDNLALIDSLGAVPFIPFKTGTGHGEDRRKNADPRSQEVWRRSYHYFQFQNEEWKKDFHVRSNIEAVFSMVKRKLGNAVRSKTPTAQHNEVLCKFICHNLMVLIHAIYNLGIEPMFWNGDDEADDQS